MIRLAVSLALLLALPASAGAQTATMEEGAPTAAVATEDQYRRVVARAVDDYIIPAYGRLQGATAELGPALGDLCLFDGEYERSSVAHAFASTIEAWAGVDFLRFGPMAQEGRYERFAFFPDVHGTGARQLRRFLATEDEALLEPGALAEQSAAVQGMPALESLLFSGSKALLDTEDMQPYRCALAVRIAGNLNAIASQALLGWMGGADWATLIENPGSANPVYRSHSEAMTEILRAVLTGLEQLRDHRLLPAVAETPADAKASRAPYNLSGQALPYLTASADALQRFVESSGILDLVPQEDRWIANAVSFEFVNLKSALAAAGSDLEAVLSDREKREKLVYAIIVLASLRDLFQRRLAPAAGLTPGFNSLDGD